MFSESLFSSFSLSDILLSLKALHPFTGEAIPVLVSSSVQFDEFNDVQLGLSVSRMAERQVAVTVKSVSETC